MYFPCLLALLVTILGWLNISYWFDPNGVSRVWQLEERVITLKNSNAKLKAGNKVLMAEVLDLKQGLESIEERARSDLGMIKADEVFYLLPNMDSLNANK